AATLGMLIAVGLGTELGLSVSTLFVVFIAIVSDGRIEIVIYHLVGPIVAILSLGKAERVNSFLLAGLATAAANSAVIIAFRFNDPTIDILGLSTLLGASIANGAISGALTLTGLFLLGYVFDITTSLQLVELSRPNHPLLVQLLRTAPGTYQHSLHVANLAEQAARNIGANTMLVRVSALFHDIGKTTNPEYFVENQAEGRNPHTNMDPQFSSNVIVSHVTDGDTMAKKHRLPTVIRDAILEHHGTTITRYQYDNALKIAEENDEKVDVSEYTYPGPKPQSPETALLMLADGCEAKAKADNPSTTEEIDKIVRFIINRRLKHGQLDECNLSLTDLGKVRESFVTTLRGYYPNRLKYPPEPSVEEPLVEDLDQSTEINDTKTSDQ
ncbi:MAG: HDIG domain-containing metalloprotein, partial [Chloroflexota bacterium]|nr:HDIG domain-containing metalloprotein [Chloroflexota bacterium]